MTSKLGVTPSRFGEIAIGNLQNWTEQGGGLLYLNFTYLVKEIAWLTR